MIAFTTKRYPWCPTIPSTIKVPFFFFFFWFIDPLYACKQPNYYEILTKLSDEVPYNILTSGQLKKEYILLNLFCKYNMMPTNITSTVIVRDALIYSWILEGKHFVLVALLCYSAVASLTNASKFLQWLSNTVATLVVPSLVMPLCLTHDVPVSSFDQMYKAWGPLSDCTIYRSLSFAHVQVAPTFHLFAPTLIGVTSSSGAAITLESAHAKVQVRSICFTAFWQEHTLQK